MVAVLEVAAQKAVDQEAVSKGEETTPKVERLVEVRALPRVEEKAWKRVLTPTAPI